LIECLTYRQCGHSRSDPRTYRSKEEEEDWKKRDPIEGFRSFLLTNQVTSPERLAQIDESVEERLKEAIAFAESSPEPVPADVYSDVIKE
jgi:TPP-dependent pyruvate/acetoin dehydrogenase alpha subunit